MLFLGAPGDGGNETVTQAPQDQVRDTLDLSQGFHAGGLHLGDLQQRPIPQNLERRAIHLTRALVPQEEQLSQHGKAERVEVSCALDAQVSELVELALGPFFVGQIDEFFFGPAQPLGPAELLLELLGHGNQVCHIGRSVVQLSLSKRTARPVRALLILGEGDSEVPLGQGSEADSRVAE